jgi:pimeloyl-ACP methyl ester carboxylesterase
VRLDYILGIGKPVNETPSPRVVPVVTNCSTVTIRERTVTFGQGQSLLGIETRAVEQPGPTAGAQPSRPAVVLLNAGVVHRVGPHRLTVNLARRFARAGYHTFRFDLTGIGDSRARRGTSKDAPYETVVVEDIRAAMDHMQKATGADRFILGGLCSGADNSLRVALVDPRVAAIALLDPYAYRTAGFYLRHYLARVGRLSSWMGTARRGAESLLAAGKAKLASLRRGGANGEPEITVPSGPQYSRYHPPRQLFAAQLRQLVDRGTAIYIAYSGSLDAVYNHAAQFEEAFRPYGIRNDEVRCTFIPVANHTYTELAEQRRLGDALVGWAETLRPRSA